MSELPTSAQPSISLKRSSLREKLTAIFSALVVVSLHLVFRVTIIARHWNY